MFITKGEYMELRDYLFYEKVKSTDLANRIGITLQHFSGISNQRTKVTKPIAKLIEIETNGKVTAAELLKGNEKFLEKKALSA
jgi:hypothetical protein